MYGEHTQIDEARIVYVNKSDDWWSDYSAPSWHFLPSTLWGLIMNLVISQSSAATWRRCTTKQDTRVSTGWISATLMLTLKHPALPEEAWWQGFTGWSSPLSLILSLLSPSSHYRADREPSSLFRISNGISQGIRVKGSGPPKELWPARWDKNNWKSHSIPVILSTAGLEKGIQGRCGAWQL